MTTKEIYIKIRDYRLEIFMAICLFSNLYPDIPDFLYYVLLILTFFMALRNKANVTGERASLAIGMLAVIVLTSTINFSLSMRVPLFILVFLVSLIFSSYKYYKFKVRLLRCILWGCALTVPLNYYAHVAGINYQLFNSRHIGEEFTLDFAGFTNHPMWLSAACALATIFFVYHMINIWNKKGIGWSLIMVPFIFGSVMVTIWGASRSAIGISIGASLLLIYIANNKITKTFGIITVIVFASILAMPRFIEGSERMQGKQKYQQEIGQNSRTALWNARLEELASSPLWGIGFSATGIGDKKQVGRAETGSGWLSVLSQSGIIGMILILLIVKRALIPLHYLRENREMALYFVLFVFMSLHTLFEAYIFQGGWYLCLVYWLLVGVLDDYKKYRKIALILKRR